MPTHGMTLPGDMKWGPAPPVFQPSLRHEVRVTVLHELGHHLGLDEDRLGDLGYG